MKRNLTVILYVLVLSSFLLSPPLVTAVGGNCLLPDGPQLEILLTSALQELSSSQQPEQIKATLHDFNFTCLTVAEMQGYYTFLTASILYSSTESSNASRAFFDVGCRNLNPDVWDIRVNQARNSIRGSGSDAALRTDCGGCANPDIIPASLGLEFDEETHCYTCDEACLQSELRLCTGLSQFLCCNVYDNGQCALECPLNKEPDHDYNCQCINNFTGSDCKTCGLDCKDGTIQSENCTVCMCPIGFTGDGCQSDIDECESSPCFNGNCSNLVGSFQCSCEEGFTGNLCEVEINACESAPCMNGASCTSHRGRFNCECAIDFTGLTCETRIDDCNPDPCLNNATCLDGKGNFTCLCPDNFDGLVCGDCLIDNCSKCSLTERGVCLQCLPNYHLDEQQTCACGLTCENGGLPNADCTACDCPNGFTGQNCESDVNECQFSPCVNGLCLNLFGSFDCLCNCGFTGVLCDIDDSEGSSSTQVQESGLDTSVVVVISLLAVLLVLNVFSLIVMSIVCHKQRKSKSRKDVGIETEEKWIEVASHEEKTDPEKEETKINMS